MTYMTPRVFPSRLSKSGSNASETSFTSSGRVQTSRVSQDDAPLVSSTQISSTQISISIQEKEQLRKINHSAIEKKRRIKTALTLDKLKHLCPQSRSQQNIQKLVILENAVEYIQALESKIAFISACPPPPAATSTSASSYLQNANDQQQIKPSPSPSLSECSSENTFIHRPSPIAAPLHSAPPTSTLHPISPAVSQLSEQSPGVSLSPEQQYTTNMNGHYRTMSDFSLPPLMNHKMAIGSLLC